MIYKFENDSHDDSNYSKLHHDTLNNGNGNNIDIGGGVE